MSKEKNRPSLPFKEIPFGDILQSIDSFFQDTVRSLQAPRFIPIHQYETKNEYIIEAELPGVKKEQVSLDIYHNFIKISVQSEEVVEETDDINKTYKHNHRFERAERVVQVPFAVNESEVKAELNNGLLRIKIPNKKKRIEIN
ncbi:Hsp20/alpha crystallin family protein [Evansella sp. AB-P1]|uniref:Hsp20/alpha crystallin family protein n=1 Tax=Evansella sp. AB-P1 TaxID=3037653 RepID=UPI00241F035E|nr:Hsp20/alpha crystallin family protein [Evansella sp. AB-P1]MDG5789511.1 Hsp20/alpha crystallin family protein [Evansella sp. AB-P1]